MSISSFLSVERRIVFILERIEIDVLIQSEIA